MSKIPPQIPSKISTPKEIHSSQTSCNVENVTGGRKILYMKGLLDHQGGLKFGPPPVLPKKESSGDIKITSEELSSPENSEIPSNVSTVKSKISSSTVAKEKFSSNSQENDGLPFNQDGRKIKYLKGFLENANGGFKVNANVPDETLKVESVDTLSTDFQLISPVLKPPTLLPKPQKKISDTELQAVPLPSTPSVITKPQVPKPQVPKPIYKESSIMRTSSTTTTTTTPVVKETFKESNLAASSPQRKTTDENSSPNGILQPSSSPLSKPSAETKENITSTISNPHAPLAKEASKHNITTSIPAIVTDTAKPLRKEDSKTIVITNDAAIIAINPLSSTPITVKDAANISPKINITAANLSPTTNTQPPKPVVKESANCDVKANIKTVNANQNQPPKVIVKDNLNDETTKQDVAVSSQQTVKNLEIKTSGNIIAASSACQTVASSPQVAKIESKLPGGVNPKLPPTNNEKQEIRIAEPTIHKDAGLPQSQVGLNSNAVDGIPKSSDPLKFLANYCYSCGHGFGAKDKFCLDCGIKRF
ncbi:hypothetical protein HK099_000558 [Clydaea vesicula]|uniref:Uncharacterized protein n=1 Tax=Clydaea vesicula TaxID=447962 RepID=A0AAD5U460_9FUNG|nr:hypothetical protein HK099_000558 [Clydaea vesicula]